jgi:hypothetical protein
MRSASARATGSEAARTLRRLRFRIGSITKSFAVVAILQLAEAGWLTVDDRTPYAAGAIRSTAQDRSTSYRSDLRPPRMFRPSSGVRAR